MVRPDALDERLAQLRKEHERLLKQVAQAKSTLSKRRQQLEAAELHTLERISPFKRRFDALVQQIKVSFEGVIKRRRQLDREARRQLKEVYQAIASEFGFADLDESFKPPASKRSTESDERSAAESGFSADKPDPKVHQTLRAIFRRLAVALHPDRTVDQAEKLSRTAAMKDITRAYQAGDVAQLVELERRWSAHSSPQPSGEDKRRTVAQLKQASLELRQQLRAIKDITRRVREELAALPADALELELWAASSEQQVVELEKIGDLVARLKRSELTLEAFLFAVRAQLPNPKQPSIEDVIRSVAAGWAEEPPKPRRRAKRNNTKKRQARDDIPF